MSTEVERNTNPPSFTDLVLSSGEKLSDVLTPVLIEAQFMLFKEDLKNGEYEKVYTSAVFCAVDALCSKQNITTLKAGTTVWRARIIRNMEEIYGSKKGIHFEGNVLRGYNWYESKEPAVGISSEGRANSKYSSYFYCAVDGPTAASEIKANIGDYISLASFTIQRDLKLIRLTETDIADKRDLSLYYQNVIARQFSIPVTNSSEYHPTQFISDEMRKHGIDGICFKSHFTNKDNYVIFNCSMDTISFVNSKIIQLYSQQLNYIDFSTNQIIKSQAIPDLDPQRILEEKTELREMMEAYQEELMKEELDD